MTIAEAIAAANELRPNNISAATKTRWLHQHDCLIWEELVRDYETDTAKPSLEDYADDDQTVLLVPEEDAELEVNWLLTQIDYHHADYERYNNDAAMWAAGRDAYAKKLGRRIMYQTNTQVESRERPPAVQILY